MTSVLKTWVFDRDRHRGCLDESSGKQSTGRSDSLTRKTNGSMEELELTGGGRSVDGMVEEQVPNPTTSPFPPRRYQKVDTMMANPTTTTSTTTCRNIPRYYWIMPGLFFFLLAGIIVFATSAPFVAAGESPSASSSSSLNVGGCHQSVFNPVVLSDPCSNEVQTPAPEMFDLIWPTQYGSFTTQCVRARAPVWVDRIYHMARYGYYNDNYFLRVIPNKYVQFGTNGDPAISNVYNWSSTTNSECGIVHPQPPDMSRCMADTSLSQNCSIDTDDTDVDVLAQQSSSNTSSSNHSTATTKIGLSNTFGTMAMSTNYADPYPGYPSGVTWNATAELFINIGHNNQHLDANLFVPICTLNNASMDVVLTFPSFGELADLGGPGPDLGLLYQDGNAYIEANESYDTMAQSDQVSVCVPGIETDAEGNGTGNDNGNEDPSCVRRIQSFRDTLLMVSWLLPILLLAL